MKNKIKELLNKFFCLHNYETKKSYEMMDASFVSFGEAPFYSGTIKQCCCSKCGKWKSYRIQ